MSIKLITIDGPSASGKSSVSRLVAKRLGWNWVSTGAFYRGLAFAAIQEKFDPNNESELVQLVHSSVWSVQMKAEETEVLYKNQPVTDNIQGEQVGAVASSISRLSQVRAALLERQRDCFNPEEGLVAEGRDCGTVVFPQSLVKIYLTANPALRALRRSEEDGKEVERTLKQQIERDKRDSERKTAPLIIAKGALTIDSSYLSLDEVVQEVIKYAKSQKVPFNDSSETS